MNDKMEDKDFYDLKYVIMNELKIREISTDPGAIQNTVFAVIRILDNMGALNWPKEMKELTDEEKLEFIKEAKSKKSSKENTECTCGKGSFGSHWCEKCKVFTGGFRKT